MAGKNTTFLRGAHFDDPNTPRTVEFSKHAEHSARRSGVDPRVGTVHKHGMGTPPIHGGMHTRAKTGDHLAFAGGDMASALSSGSVGPSIGDHLSGYPKPHDMAPVPIHPSMASAAKRSVHSPDVMRELGRKILETAEGPDRNGFPRLIPRARK